MCTSCWWVKVTILKCNDVVMRELCMITHWKSFHNFCLFLQNWDDQAHLSFVQSHLSEILELLVEPGKLSQSGQTPRDCQVCTKFSCQTFHLIFTLANNSNLADLLNIKVEHKISEIKSTQNNKGHLWGKFIWLLLQSVMSSVFIYHMCVLNTVRHLVATKPLYAENINVGSGKRLNTLRVERTLMICTCGQEVVL